MKTHTLAKSLLAVTAAALSLAAVAETPAAAETKARPAGPCGFLQRYDTDGDGMITLAEFQSAGDALFARLDLDGDGRLSADEFKSARETFGRHARDGRRDRADRPRREGEAERGRRDGAEGRGAHRGAHAGSHGHRGLVRMDADGDGFVSKAEFDDARLARFGALDVNGNGVIDADELPQWRGKGEGRGYGKRDFSRSK